MGGMVLAFSCFPVGNRDVLWRQIAVLYGRKNYSRELLSNWFSTMFVTSYAISKNEAIIESIVLPNKVVEALRKLYVQIQ